MKEKCLRFQCKNCKDYLLCFRNDSQNEIRKSKNKQVKTNQIQSKNIIGRTYQNTLVKMKYEGQSFGDGMKNEYISKKDLYDKIFGKS